MYDVKVDEAKCVGCGECEKVCPVDVYEIQNEKEKCRGNGTVSGTAIFWKQPGSKWKI